MRRRITGILFAIFILLLFLEILVGFPLKLEKETDSSWVDSYIAKQKGLPPPQDSSGAEDGQTVQQHAQGVHLVESQQGNRDWELFAESADSADVRGQWKLHKMEVLFYNKEKMEFTVTGERGEINPTSKDMMIEGHVVTKSTNGYKFVTEAITYSAKTRVLRSPGHVWMQGPPDNRGKGLVLEGDSMETFVDQNLMSIRDHVIAKKVLSNGKEFRIRANTAQFSGADKTAKFLGGVSIESGTMKMEGPEADFQYQDGTNLLQAVQVVGGVKVSDIDKYATADTIHFDPTENQLILSGNPRVVQNNDELTGDRIIFIDGGKKVKVEKVRVKKENTDDLNKKKVQKK
jgi:LPS export ABC transporter protein LptC/lipopolysaccharide transport protein LptA